MVNVVYDHVVAIILVGVIFVWAVGVLPAMSVVSIEAADQQQLRNTALNVFNAILLDEGSAVNGSELTLDWGSVDPFLPADVKEFGLADSKESAFFVLDPDKVQRLVVGNPLGDLNNSKAKELLGIDGYGFSLKILPPFNATNIDGTKIDEDHSPINETALETGELQFSVKVSYLDGRPIPNAVIQTTAIYTDKDDFWCDTLSSATTDSSGVANYAAILETAPSAPYHITVIIRITVADVATMVVTFGRSPVDLLDINVVGDEIVVTKPKGGYENDATVWIYEILVYTSDGQVISIFLSEDTFINTGVGSPLRLWEEIFPELKALNPVLVIFNIWTTLTGEDYYRNGRQEVVVAGPYQNLLGYTVFEYGLIPDGSPATAKLQRSVIISDMTYTAQLILWEEAS